jgi:hypothetical protein
VRAIACLAAAALCASGCSFMVVRGPPRPDCTTRPIAPVLDTAIFGLAAFGALYAHQRLDEPDGGEFPNNDFLRMQRTFSFLGAVLFGASAGYGYLKVASCRRTHPSSTAR